MTKSAVIIRKYGNRRLYDTSKSRYINLDEIAAMVRNGTEMQVVDASTGEDLTRLILTQIIVENAKARPSSVPTELLRELITVTDHVGREFITWYLRSAFDAYHKVQQTLRTELTGGDSGAASPLALLQRFLPSSTPNTVTRSDELEILRKRIKRLEAQQRSEKSGKARSAKRKPRNKAATSR